MIIGKRYIDGDRLLAYARLNGVDRLEAWLRRQPRKPELVSRQGAAKILGKHTSHLRRLENRLPEPIYIEGNRWPFYMRADIVALKKELEQEEADRRKPEATAKV